jgi:hypothetical protein
VKLPFYPLCNKVKKKKVKLMVAKWGVNTLFFISEDRDAFVVVLISFRHGFVHWELNFSRKIQDWELDSMTSFLEVVYSATMTGHGVDNLCWKQRSKGGFAMKSFYRCLNPPFTMTFPWKGICKPKVPPRVTFFMWIAALGKVFTAENLRN